MSGAIETIVNWYMLGAVGMLAWMAIMDMEHDARSMALVLLLWPLFLAIVLAVYPFILLERHAGWAVRLVRRRAGLSPWGMHRPSDGRKGFGLRCPLWELQVIKVMRAKQ